MARKSLCEVPERTLCDIEMEAGMNCINENVGDPCAWAVHHEKLHTGVEESQEINVY